MNLRIGDLIEAPPVQTVIKLDDGTSDPGAITSTFVCTEDVTTHLSIFAGALKRDVGKGFFLEGDFGSGKSHFLAALSAWTADREGAGKLSDAIPYLAECKTLGKKFLAVDISLVKYRSATPLERIVVAAVESALAAKGHAARLSTLGRFQTHLGEILTAPAMAAAFESACGIPARSIAEWFSRQPNEAYTASIAFLKKQGVGLPEVLIEERHEVFSRALEAVRTAGFSGMVLIIDELSEFFRSKTDAAALNEDARTLQLLGELTTSNPLWIIAAVQESIERTGDIASATFRKIKDRFPTRFHLSTLHIRDLIGKRLVRHKPGADEKILALYEVYRRYFPGFSCTFDQFVKIYPVHPETLQLLEGLGNLFSQHRGIVDFVHTRIAGDAGRGIPGILDRDAGELLAPDAIYDHFSGRLAEFSAFHVYPRTIIPHLDETIDRIIEEPADRALAKRIVRMLVLYAVHPTARKPTVRELAQLGSCMLASHDPDVNVEFVAGVLLDPLAAQSRFLVKRSAPSGNPLDAVYELTAQEDLAGTLRRRIQKAIAEVRGGDSRVLLEPLTELAASMSWPGPQIMTECPELTVVWRQTTRKAIVVFLGSGEGARVAEKLGQALDAGRADFALVIVAGNDRCACRHAAVWRMGGLERDGGVLTEYFAARSVARELSSTNPSHAPLIPLVNDQVKRLEPAVRSALMEIMYAGAFDDREIVVDPSALQVRRFDRLLEAAAGRLLEERYPRFKEIAPRTFQPSMRLYQTIVDKFVALGSISMSEARAASLTEAIETLAAPLGLVEVKSGSYRFAPVLGEHPFLKYAFSLLRSAGPTPLDEVIAALKSGVWGVPQETAEFLLVSLAYSGAVMLLRSGRAVAFDLLSMSAVASADAVVPGEIISEADRQTLMAECPFLAPQGGWPSFGLRQQREAWQALIKMKGSFESLLDETNNHLASMEAFEAFASLNFEALGEKVTRISGILSEVKVSYQAREGIERFCAAWRASGFTAGDVELLKKTHRFFTRFADKFIFIAHYLRHRSVEQAGHADEEISSRREALAIMLNDPLDLVLPDEGAQLGAAFDLFREAYSRLYGVKHREFYEARRTPKPGRAELRMLDVFGRLSRIEQLDRPQGLDALLRINEKEGEQEPCHRPVTEELLRSPACGCGYSIGQPAPAISTIDRADLLERAFLEYRGILGAPGVVEAVTAHAYALRDMDAPLAARLEKVCSLARGSDATAAQPLLDVLDDATIAEIGRALSGSVKVKQRGLAALVAALAGRRLSPSRVRAVFNAWLAENEESTLLAIGELPGQNAGAAERPSWWSFTHPELTMKNSVAASPEEAGGLENALEKYYPSSTIEKLLSRLDRAERAKFLMNEPFHTQAIRATWTGLLNDALSGDAPLPADLPRSRHYAPSIAAAIDLRYRTLDELLRVRKASFPERLRARLHAAALWTDEWTSRDARKSLESIVADIDKKGSDWLASLDPTTVIDMDDSPLVVIIDALPPDVWLESLPQLGALLDNASVQWRRITTLPNTVASMSSLFGFPPDRDPIDEFAARGAKYSTVNGDEQHPLIDLLPPFDAGVAYIVRINLIDKAAHGGTFQLHQLPAMVTTLLTRNLPGLMDLTKKQSRRLVMTADHGLSWSSGTLSHGKGGVFEKAVVRVEWRK
jgi:hypothetical protein